MNTEKNRIGDQSQWLTIKPFKSNISDLFLFVQTDDGVDSKRIAMSDTEIFIEENICGFDFFWFEYFTSDKVYEIPVYIN